MGGEAVRHHACTFKPNTPDVGSLLEGSGLLSSKAASQVKQKLRRLPGEQVTGATDAAGTVLR